MGINDYLRIIRRRWVIIVSTLLACVILSAAYTAQVVPQYASKASVFVSTAPNTTADAYQGGLFSQERVQSYADLMDGLKLSQRVVDELHLNMTAEALSKKISAAVVPNTVLLDITVTDPSPAQAQLINRAVVAQLEKMITEIETPPGKKLPLLKTTVVDPPQLPHSPVTPRTVLNVSLAGLLGLLLGFGLAVVRELMDNTVKDPRHLPGLRDVPMLASLALDGDVPKHPLIATLPAHAPRVEAFRVLRTNLQFLDVDTASRAFVVTSSVPGEGKSTTAVNIALALAQADQNVLLIDADLRRPQVARMLGLEGAVGLTTLLVGHVEVTDAVQTHVDSGLDVLAAGAIPPNPAELLQTQTMRDLMVDLRTRYDLIIIDSSPLLPVTDAALLSSLADGAVMVVRYGRTTRDQVTGAVERLHQVDAKPQGIILNMVPRKRGLTGYGYSYGYGYGYGYAPEDDPASARTTGAVDDVPPASPVAGQSADPVAVASRASLRPFDGPRTRKDEVRPEPIDKITQQPDRNPRKSRTLRRPRV